MMLTDKKSLGRFLPAAAHAIPCRRVNQEDAEKCEERFTRSKMVGVAGRFVFFY